MNIRKSLVVGVICLMMLVSVPIISGYDKSSELTNTGGLADNIRLWCEGSYIVDIISRADVFHIMVANDNDEEIWLKFSITVTKLDGTIIFDKLTAVPPHPMGPRTLDYWSIYTYPDFRGIGYMFGFFDLHVEFDILNDGSKVEKTFHGFIYGISAKIFYAWNFIDNRF